MKELLNFLKQLSDEGSSHYDLLKAFEDLVVKSKWCGKREFMDMLEEYKFMKK